MTTPDMKEIRSIVDWVNATDDVRELSLKIGDLDLFISKNRESRSHVPAPAPADAPATVATAASAASTPVAEAAPAAATSAPAAAPAAPAEVSPATELAADEVIVTAPMVGVFYGSPQPGAPSFVSVGDQVQENTVLGIVEVMKLMNNIEAKVSGEVVRILVENEQAVEFGQPLVIIKRSA